MSKWGYGIKDITDKEEALKLLDFNFQMHREKNWPKYSGGYTVEWEDETTVVWVAEVPDNLWITRPIN